MKVAIIEKPSIPQFVADWLESLSDEGGDWQTAIGIMFDCSGLSMIGLKTIKMSLSLRQCMGTILNESQNIMQELKGGN